MTPVNGAMSSRSAFASANAPARLAISSATTISRPVAERRPDPQLAVLRGAEPERRTDAAFDAAHGERHQFA